jgi:hypothetical protein
MYPRLLTREEFEAIRGPVTGQSHKSISCVRDWAVYSVTDRGPKSQFRYRVAGLNTNDNNEFSWDISQITWRYYWDAE